MRFVMPLCALALVLFYSQDGSVAQTTAGFQSRPPGSITFYAPNAVHTMDTANTIYSSITITNGIITAVSNAQPGGATLLPPGAAIYPGFIDSHSHLVSELTAQAKDPLGKPYWISLANVNVMLLADCPTATPGSVSCFSAVKTQGTVNALLKAGPANSANWILGWNYEPSRLACKVNGLDTYGFLCPNFENQNTKPVRVQLDELQPTTPTLVTSESGHIVYVNTAGRDNLNICNVSKGANSSCYTPVINTEEEKQMAIRGQLDEDVAIYALSYIENQLATSYAGSTKLNIVQFYANQIAASLNLYSQLGFTTVQEGAASYQLIGMYMSAAAKMFSNKQYFPATVAFLEYDGTTPKNFGTSVTNAVAAQKSIASGKFDMFVAGMKAFSDGSNQGYTGAMASPVTYMNLNQPFLNAKIFSQPYDGLADYTQQDLTQALSLAHAQGFPLWVHTNGNQAQTNVLNALATGTSTTIRDVVVHFTMPTATQVGQFQSSHIGATFLVNDYYYYYQPLCEQVLGPAATQNLYPALWAQQSKIHFGLHSDSSVTPPSPLFSMWVATTRNYQDQNWLPKMSVAGCQAAVKTSQKISRLQAMRAYTSDAAWLYNRETSIGSLQPNYKGDLVILSADPLGQGVDPSKIFVLYTIHNGNIVYPASGTGPATSGPVWPK